MFICSPLCNYMLIIQLQKILTYFAQLCHYWNNACNRALCVCESTFGKYHQAGCFGVIQSCCSSVCCWSRLTPQQWVWDCCYHLWVNLALLKYMFSCFVKQLWLEDVHPTWFCGPGAPWFWHTVWGAQTDTWRAIAPFCCGIWPPSPGLCLPFHCACISLEHLRHLVCEGWGGFESWRDIALMNTAWLCYCPLLWVFSCLWVPSHWLNTDKQTTSSLW